MTIERRSPLPPGRYWIDTFAREGSNGPELFQQWAASKGGVVQVVATEEDSGSEPPRTWFLFRVIGPLLPEWERELAVQIGFPTVADASVQTSDDTVQKPDVSAPPAWGVGLILGGVGLLALAGALFFGGKKQ